MLYSLGLLLAGPFLVCSSVSLCEILGRTAWFSFCNLTEVPQVRSTTTALVLGFNHIRQLNATTFPLLGNLRLLQLDNQIPGTLTIQKNSFRNLPNLITLDLRFNIMLILDQDAFVGLSNLEILQLDYNTLNSSILENNFFRDLRSLEILDLSNNVITYLKPNPLFYRLYYFHALILKYNHISRICEGDLHSFHQKNFTVMDLSSNSLHVSDASVWEQCGNPFRNIYFQTLILSSNGFSGSTAKALFNALNGTKVTYLQLSSHVMGAGFGYKNIKDPENSTFAGLENSNLKILDISTGTIFSLKPYVFGHLHELQILSVSKNKINQIEPEAFEGLKSLQNLNMSHNLLGELYNNVFDGLTSLRFIHLHNNHIGEIQGETFKNLPNLQFVDLRDNALKSVVFWEQITLSLMFINLKDNKLKQIDSSNVMSTTINLSENQLENLGDLFKILQRPLIKQITMRNNRLTTCFPLGFYISRNNSLSYLDLSDNMIQLIWENGFCLDIFLNLSSLENLFLSNNHLRYLPEGVFNGLVSLKFLNLSSNFFTYLISGILPVSLETLDISKNQLLSPSPQLFMNLKALDITDNKFICDCPLVDFIVWLNQTNTTLLGSPEDIYCIYPTHLLFQQLSHYDINSCNEVIVLRSLMFSLFVFTSVVIVMFLTSAIVYNHFRGVFFGLYQRIVQSILEGKVDEEQEVWKYDAFLCYARKDFQWVENAFIKNLDCEYCDKNRFSLCFEERNFLPGEDHIVNIREAIWNSKKTICIVTKQFLRDGWCVEAFNYAQSRYFTEMKDVLVMVVVGSLSEYQLRKFKPIRAYMQRCQYLKWPDDYQDVDWFLSRLSYKLLKEEKVEKKQMDVTTKGSTIELQQIATLS